MRTNISKSNFIQLKLIHAAITQENIATNILKKPRVNKQPSLIHTLTPLRQPAKLLILHMEILNCKLNMHHHILNYKPLNMNFDPFILIYSLNPC